jgi:hypothetical protein
LVHLFNDIGLFISNDSIKEHIFARLQKNVYLEENNRLNYSLAETIDALNYLIQNHRTHQHYADVYERYLSVLEAKATYYTLT